MKRSGLVLILRWAIPGLIFGVFTVLPSLANMLSVDNVKQENVWISLFYSIMLSHPFLRAAQLILHRSRPQRSDPQTFSEFREKGLGIEYLISRGGYLLIGIVIILMALTSIFKTLFILHYIVVILYGLSTVLLDLGIEEAVSRQKDEPAD